MDRTHAGLPPTCLPFMRFRTALTCIVALTLLGVVVVGVDQHLSTTGHPTVPTVTPARPSVPLFPLSSFDHPVAGRPVVPQSRTYVDNLVRQYQSHHGAVGVNGLPIFRVPANQPEVPVSVRPGCNSFSASTGPALPIPRDAHTTDPQYQNDSAMVIYQPATGTEWELWQAAMSSTGTWSACAGGRLQTKASTGVFPSPFGLSATGISYLATTITEADVASGHIDHTLAMDVARCDYHAAPAVRGDCGHDPGQPPEGTWFKLPADRPVPSSLTAFGRMVFHALQTYGAIVTDQAGGVEIQAESPPDQAGAVTDPITASWQGRPEYAALDGMPWSSLEAIQPG